MEAQRYNFRAQALSLTDLKSVALNFIIEQMGLAEPDRYTWTLRERAVGNGGCPADVGYAVIKRNFEVSPTAVDQLQASSYVNGTLYSYRITEFCQNTPFLADAVEFPVDPLANTLTAVASGAISVGSFFTGLTRDDVAGLRYLLRANNFNVETAGQGTETFVTNNNVQLLYTSNLTQLAEASLVNDAVGLTTLFPGLQIASTTQYFTNLVSTNSVTYFTNYPWSPSGTAATLATATVVSTNIVLRYKHEFANVVTNHFYGSGTYTVTTTNSSRAACQQYPWLPGNFICYFRRAKQLPEQRSIWGLFPAAHQRLWGIHRGDAVSADRQFGQQHYDCDKSPQRERIFLPDGIHSFHPACVSGENFDLSAKHNRLTARSRANPLRPPRLRFVDWDIF